MTTLRITGSVIFLVFAVTTAYPPGTPEDIVPEDLKELTDTPEAKIDTTVSETALTGDQPKAVQVKTKTPTITLGKSLAANLLLARKQGGAANLLQAKEGRGEYKKELIAAYKKDPNICKDWISSENCHSMRKRFNTCAVGFNCGGEAITTPMSKACCSTCSKDIREYCTDIRPWCSYVTDTQAKREKYCTDIPSGGRRRKKRASPIKSGCKRSCGVCRIPGTWTDEGGFQDPDYVKDLSPDLKKAVVAADQEETFAESALRTTNIYRCMHGVPPVKWSSAVAASAEEWANKKEYKHSASYQVKSPAGPAGENLALGHGTIAAANQAWYEEVSDCKSLPGCQKPATEGKAVGHFTALIWKGVKEIGCGTAKVEGRDMYVCRYRSGKTLDGNTPNMEGHYEKNVLKKVKTREQCIKEAPVAPAAPAGQPGDKAKSQCKAKDSTYYSKEYSIKVYEKKTYTSRCAWVKETGKCTGTSRMADFYLKACPATCTGKGTDRAMWSKPYKGNVKDPATGKNKLLSEKKYSSKCAYYKMKGKCFESNQNVLVYCPATCLCGEDGAPAAPPPAPSAAPMEVLKTVEQPAVSKPAANKAAEAATPAPTNRPTKGPTETPTGAPSFAAGPLPGVEVPLKGMPVAQSSTGWRGAASRAIDGITNTKYNQNSCTHTHRNNKPWWRVDLGSATKVAEVQVWNRGDCCGGRLNNFQVRVGDQEKVSSNEQCGRGDNKIGQGQNKVVDCEGLKGRYVGVMLPKKDYLTMCEVKVFRVGGPTPEPTPAPTPDPTPQHVEISLKGMPVAQSSTGWRGAASRAIDGITNTKYNQNSCTHTHRNNKPWWRVDLGSAEEVGSVQVWNRGDCCGGRLNNFQVHVGDQTTVSDNALCAKDVAIGQGQNKVVDCAGKIGRYVSISLPKRDYLTLCEVKVYRK